MVACGVGRAKNNGGRALVFSLGCYDYRAMSFLQRLFKFVVCLSCKKIPWRWLSVNAETLLAASQVLERNTKICFHIRMEQMEAPRENGVHVFPDPRHPNWHAITFYSRGPNPLFHVGEGYDGIVNRVSIIDLLLEDQFKLVQQFCQNPQLKQLRVSCLGFRWQQNDPVGKKLAKELRASTSLEYLEFGGDWISSAYIHLLVEMLRAQCSLLGLKLDIPLEGLSRFNSTYLNIGEDFGEDFVQAVAKIKTLKILIARLPHSKDGEETLMMLMASLARDSSGHQANTSLQTLHMKLLLHSKHYERWALDGLVDSFVRMLETNRSLTTVSIPNFVHSTELVIKVLNALQVNQCVSNVILSDQNAGTKFANICWGEEIFYTLLKLIKFRNEHGHALTSVDVRGTGLEKPEYAVPIEARLKRKYCTDAAAAKFFVRPTSCRVFLCGFPEAGKTTLRKKMKRILPETAKMFHPLYSVSKRMEISRKRASKRTTGVEVVTTHSNSVELSLWDMGGQDEFHAFHDLVVPNLSDNGNASLFVLVCSLASIEEMTNNTKAKSSKKIALELQYWLRFLSSNTRLSKNRKLRVILVFTHVDLLSKTMDMRRHVNESLTAIKGLFRDFFQFSSMEYFLNSNSTQAVEPFVACVEKEAKAVLSDVPNIYRACLEMKNELAKWKEEHASETIMKWDSFVHMCHQTRVLKVVGEIDVELVHDICKTIASSLNEGGDILYFENLDVIVVDLDWFCRRIMGPILSIDHKCLDPHTKEPVTNEKGYIERAQLVSVLDKSFDDGMGGAKGGESATRRMDVDDLVCVLKKMKLCYEEHGGEGGGMQWRAVFVPATLRDEGGLAEKGRRKLKWDAIGCLSTQSQSQSQSTTYVGRRLECEDSVRTSFTAGFFPRLQVVLEREFGSRSTFRLEKNLVVFTEDGMQVQVEYSGDLDGAEGFIDILVQSLKSLDKTVQFAKEGVMKPLRSLCASPAFGCQGVTLSESIVRPECVKQLWICHDRREQAVKEKVLIRDVLAKQDFERYMHHWPRGDGDEARSLLGEAVWEAEIVLPRIAKMRELASDMMQDQDPDTVADEPEETREDELQITSLDSLYRELMKGFGKVGDDVVARVNLHTDEKMKLISDMQWKLQQAISKDINRVIDHAMHTLQRQVPCYVYVTTQDVGKTEWLISSLVPGMKTVQLHLMCEHKGSIHTVDEQKGVALRLEGEALRGVRPYVVWSLRIITMLMKVGAHTAAGLGSMVPDLEKSLLRGITSVIPHVPSDVLGKAGTPSEQVDLMKLKNYFGEEEKRTAEQWLVNFLGGRDLQEAFGLQRIQYKDESNDLAWVCQKHVEEGRTANTLELCPVPAGPVRPA